jgi:hypothetical protein
LQKVTIIFVMSARTSAWNPAPTGWIFMKFDISVFFQQCFLERGISQTNFVQKMKTHILCSKTFFFKSCHWWDNVGKYGRAGEAADDNMAHAQCMLHNYGYKHTLRISNPYCFSIATIVAQTCLKVMLYVHCLSCSVLKLMWTWFKLKYWENTWDKHVWCSRRVFKDRNSLYLSQGRIQNKF